MERAKLDKHCFISRYTESSFTLSKVFQIAFPVRPHGDVYIRPFVRWYKSFHAGDSSTNCMRTRENNTG